MPPKRGGGQEMVGMQQNAGREEVPVNAMKVYVDWRYSIHHY
jgi:hypothetical protein